ncbi:MAG: hypothetical protein EOO92_07145 [Pedobacter sp.]|nr:MAG: hypothetical protein EOO92_07145 [Pedobacter sp.]
MKKFTFSLKIVLTGAICLVFMSFSIVADLMEESSNLQTILKLHHNDASSKLAIKRYELQVTNSGFCRYRRFYANGKVEYFSFNLSKFKELDYLGSDKGGNLILRTLGDDVIVQTYNDKKQGDIDSMANYMLIPMKNIEPENLSDLSLRLTRMNAQLLAHK